MAEPSTAWGREAVSDIIELKQGVADANRRLASLEGKVDAVGDRFAEFRGEMRTFRATVVGLALFFGSALTGLVGWLSTVAIRTEAGVDGLSARVGAVEQKLDRIAPPTVIPPQEGAQGPATDR